MSTPIEQHINNVIVTLALDNYVYHMGDPGHRLNPDYYTRLDRVRASDGSRLKLKDPAVQAFFECIGINAGSVPSAASLYAAFSAHVKALNSVRTWSQDSAVQKLMALKAGNGWAELDKVLISTHCASLSHFFDDLSIVRHPGDTGYVEESGYRVEVWVTVGDNFDFTDEWFAAASSREYALRLVDMILTGKLPVNNPIDPEGPIAITDIKVFHGSEVVINARLIYTINAQLEPSQPMPISVDGPRTQAVGDSILKDLAKFAPSFDLRYLKGLVLEESLGL